MEQSNPHKLLNRQEVEDTYCIPKRYLERAGANGPVAVRFGRYVRYHVSDVESWVEANRNTRSD